MNYTEKIRNLHKILCKSKVKYPKKRLNGLYELGEYTIIKMIVKNMYHHSSTFLVGYYLTKGIYDYDSLMAITKYKIITIRKAVEHLRILGIVQIEKQITFVK